MRVPRQRFEAAHAGQHENRNPAVAVSRRAFLAVGGASLLSACAGPDGAPASAASPPPRVVTPARSVPPPPQLPQPIPVQAEPDYEVAADKAVAGQKAVALTIDDGPDPDWTPKVLRILAKHNVTATFFMIGVNVAANPGLVKAVKDAGHQVATHTWSHRNLKKLAPAAVRSEIGRGLDAVHKADSSLRPTLFRAPYGNWSPTALAACASMGQRSIMWTVDPRDWEEPGAATIASRVMSQVGDRSVVLTHDGGGDRSQTVAALRLFIPQLLASGYRFVSL
jgi:peptidoglycan/xylan/chitin deacetylase (PgdA/CDA1 family)